MEVPRAQCVECALTLSKEALKPSNLKRHLDLDFKRKENGLQIQKKTISTLDKQSKSALKVITW